MYQYEYIHYAITADCVIFGFDGQQLKVLLVKRKEYPYQGLWALPGGFLRQDETIEFCALRELHEETGLAPDYIEQLQVFSALNRDPRERVLTVAFWGLVPTAEVKGGTDAEEAQWIDLEDIPTLAFDHNEIVDVALKRLRTKISTEPLALCLLGDKFTMPQLQRVHELILGKELDRRNFKKKMVTQGFVAPLEEVEHNSLRRPATLFTAAEGAINNLWSDKIESLFSPDEVKRLSIINENKIKTQK